MSCNTKSAYLVAYFKRQILLFLILLCPILVSAQDNYWIFFRDKSGCEFNPYEYFHAKAIERRLNSGINLFDSTDFPLNQTYVEKIRENALELKAKSRWFNAVLATVSDNKINTIQNFSFVKSIEKQRNTTAKTCEIEYSTYLTEKDKRLLNDQIACMQGHAFREHKITGSGKRIAVFDNGFKTVDTNPVFGHLRKNYLIVETYDFVRKDTFVYDFSTHGTMVLSCIGGQVDDMQIGMATDAEYLLARTQENGDNFSEEENWMLAAEWADKHGADIINSSLGYTYKLHFPEEMDGKSSLVTRAANMAASKGMLVVNAAGNDGRNNWKIINAPADADSVLSVGAISANTRFHANYSSYGPTTDYRIKPNVCSFGNAIVANEKLLKRSKGTSVSAALISGFAACAWQAKPRRDNMQLFRAIERSSDLYPYYDYVHGYGIPQADYFIPQMPRRYANPTFSLLYENDTLYVLANAASLKKTDNMRDKYLFYHVEKNNGTLDRYAVIEVYQREVLKFPLSDFTENEILRFFYQGFTHECQF